MKFIDADTMEEFSYMLDDSWATAVVKSEIEDEELESLPNVVESSKFVFRALCTSEQCSTTLIGVEKNVEPSTDVCPDCSYYLFWSRESA